MSGGGMEPGQQLVLPVTVVRDLCDGLVLVRANIADEDDVRIELVLEKRQLLPVRTEGTAVHEG